MRPGEQRNGSSFSNGLHYWLATQLAVTLNILSILKDPSKKSWSMFLSTRKLFVLEEFNKIHCVSVQRIYLFWLIYLSCRVIDIWCYSPRNVRIPKFGELHPFPPHLSAALVIGGSPGKSLCNFAIWPCSHQIPCFAVFGLTI